MRHIACAAIKLQPGYANAHRNLGVLLYNCVVKDAEARGDLAKAATIYDEIAGHLTIALGAGHGIVFDCAPLCQSV